MRDYHDTTRRNALKRIGSLVVAGSATTAAATPATASSRLLPATPEKKDTYTDGEYVDNSDAPEDAYIIDHAFRDVARYKEGYHVGQSIQYWTSDWDSSRNLWKHVFSISNFGMHLRQTRAISEGRGFADRQWLDGFENDVAGGDGFSGEQAIEVDSNSNSRYYTVSGTNSKFVREHVDVEDSEWIEPSRDALTDEDLDRTQAIGDGESYIVSGLGLALGVLGTVPSPLSVVLGSASVGLSAANLADELLDQSSERPDTDSDHLYRQSVPSANGCSLVSNSALFNLFVRPGESFTVDVTSTIHSGDTEWWELVESNAAWETGWKIRVNELEEPSNQFDPQPEPANWWESNVVEINRQFEG